MNEYLDKLKNFYADFVNNLLPDKKLKPEDIEITFNKPGDYLNVSFTSKILNEKIEKIREQWKETPPWYGKVDNCSNQCTFIDQCWNCWHISEEEKTKYLK